MTNPVLPTIAGYRYLIFLCSLGDITLEAGDANSTVQIQGTASLTQGDNGEISIAIGSRPNREFPVIDINHQELVSAAGPE